MKGILQPDKRTIIGPVTMDKPDPYSGPQDDESVRSYVKKLAEYEDHIKSLPSLPAKGFEGHQPGNVSYVEDVRFEVCQEAGDEWGQQVKIPVTYAIPSPQGKIKVATIGETFSDFIRNSRDSFVKEIKEQQWSTPMRTSAEDLLICFDQMRAKIESQDAKIERLKGLIKEAFETFHMVGFPHNEPTWEQFKQQHNL